MYLFFIDGSGNTGMDLNHPTSTCYYLVAMVVHARNARALEDAATAVLARHFGDACRPGFECKGSDLYRGEGPCAQIPPAERVAIYGELLALLEQHHASLIWVAIDKAELARRYATPMHPHKLAFIFMMEQAERYLRQRSAPGLIVSDEEKDRENQTIEDLWRYKEMGTSFGYNPLELRHVVDNVHWVRSHNSRLMQLADLCAYLCQRQMRDQGKTTATALAVQRLWDGVRGRVWRGKMFPLAAEHGIKTRAQPRELDSLELR